ncbi:DUF2336 domain-containing protein [Pelagibius marinus]|uniref:DUF2336 domain-containing protein n=1 Tax=Pelagibius marinus TaxID=2762760 RepID=UPI001873105C|nr:DUF2336 domain-containing protein [Pelagibius marinus]
MSLASAAPKPKERSKPAAKPRGRGELIYARWGTCRPQLAAGLGKAMARGELTAEEKAVAVEVLKTLIRDTELEVRRTLAEHIKSSPLLPSDIALRLAQDVEAVAIPILQSSPVLTDDDLLSIISDGNPVKQRAIAGREALSEAVSGALIGTGQKTVIEILLANDGAQISNESYRSLLDAFGADTTVQELLVERPVLPFAVKERLVHLVSKALQARIIQKHALPPALVEQLGQHGRERALLQNLAALKGGREIEAAVARLARTKGLTPTLLLRVLSAGLLEFFSAGMAALARVPSANAQNALRKAGTPALNSLYARAQLPAQLQPAFQIMLEEVLERRRAGHNGTQPEMEQRIISNLVQSYRRISPDSLESVIYQLGRLKADDPDALRA